MDKHTEFLLDRIFEIREDYKSGSLGNKDYYENVVSELISALSHYTISCVDTCFNVEEVSVFVDNKFTA